MEERTQLFPIPGRWLVLMWVLPYFYLPGSDSLYLFIAANYLEGDPFFFWWSSVDYFYSSALFLLFVFLLAKYHKVDLARFFRPFPRKSFKPSLEITAFNYVLSIALIFLTFWPLSYVAPAFVQAWYIDTPAIVILDDSGYPFGPNLFSILSLAVVAPILEETVFRGVLLHRWSYKYGLTSAVLLSSAIFAALHTDPFGAFVFGIFMSYLYIRSGSLLLPIICHGLYNLVVWLHNFVYSLYDGPSYVYSLADFQSEWVLGISTTIISIAWWLRLSPRLSKFNDWKLPSLEKN